MEETTLLTRPPLVWGMRVGEEGDQLRPLNQEFGEFPPSPLMEGMVAIGWPGIGDMRIWRDDYRNYRAKFALAYPDPSPQAAGYKANAVWNFAFHMQKGDRLVCPSLLEKLVLVGTVSGDYDIRFQEPIPAGTEHLGIPRGDFTHCRRVRWTHVLPSSDPRYEVVRNIGQKALSKLSWSLADFEAALVGAVSAPAAAAEAA